MSESILHMDIMSSMPTPGPNEVHAVYDNRIDGFPASYSEKLAPYISAQDFGVSVCAEASSFKKGFCISKSSDRNVPPCLLMCSFTFIDPYCRVRRQRYLPVLLPLLLNLIAAYICFLTMVVIEHCMVWLLKQQR